ncbi:MAG: MGMT family protein [Thermoplasmata archaeon]|nr:MGMT family protein [Thermoplasmata archaeon]
MARRKTWVEKLHDKKDLPKVVKLEGKMSKRFGEGTMVIPSPVEVDAVMKMVPEGRVITVEEIRKYLARKHGTDIACPLTTGIFVWIAANAAEEIRERGGGEITPYWRTLKSGGYLNEKYPGGAERHKELLEAEGHTVVRRGKRYLVENYREKVFIP